MMCCRGSIKFTPETLLETVSTLGAYASREGLRLKEVSLEKIPDVEVTSIESVQTAWGTIKIHWIDR